jgi:hypothetical protein
VEVVAELAEKSFDPIPALIVPQEHRTFSRADAQIAVLIRLLGPLPKTGNRERSMKHPKSKTVSSLNDENIVDALQTDHARFVSRRAQMGDSPNIPILAVQMLIRRPI